MNTPRLREAYRATRDSAIRGLIGQMVAHLPCRLFILAGMKRSGNHVFLNWFMKQNLGITLLFNHVSPDQLPTERKRQEIRFGSPFVPVTAIASYEDRRLDMILDGGLARFRKIHDARILSTELCVIVRDPQNLLASRLKKWPEEFESPDRLEAARACYLEHQSVALGGDEFRGIRVTPILYNAFIASRPYRDLLSARLRIRCGDRGLDEVPSYGHGSSFDGMAKQGRAAEMDVFSRWKSVAGDPRFVQAMTDDRMRLARDAFEVAVSSRLRDEKGEIRLGATPQQP